MNECVGISEILHYSVSLLKRAVCVSSFVEVASMIWHSFFGILVLFIKQDIFCFVLFVPRISKNGANAGVNFTLWFAVNK